MRDSPFSDDKENDKPDLEEFGYTKTYTSSAASDINGSPSAKDSPSRRKRLLGTLRSMSSLRSLRSPSSKEKAKTRVEYELELEPEASLPREVLDVLAKSTLQSPRTPTRVPQIRPSLTLNFEQSPPDEPMFDLSRRRRSVSSSLDVQHSSPVPIPITVQQQTHPRTANAQSCELPAGTIPKSPTPIQLILDKDPNKGVAVPAYPSPPNMREIIEPLPTPMPGTNVGFSENDLTGDASSKQNVMSFREGSSYFEFPVPDVPNDVEDAEFSHQAQCLADIAAKQDSFTISTVADGKVMALAALDEVEKARLQRKHTLERRHSVSEADGNDHCVQHPCAPERLAYDTVHSEDPAVREYIADECYSPIDIEHVVFEDRPEVVNRRPGNAYASARAADQVELDKLAQLQRESDLQEHAAGDSLFKPAPNAWGTHGSLYDGTGYGDSSSSNSPRPSTSYTAPGAGIEMSGGTVYRVDSLAEDSVAIARDHETLEEVIRAYAAFEDESGISEGMIGHVIAEAQADVELAESMADYSLGA